MRLNGKKVLVTGAGGFIGSHLVEELVKKAGKVNAFVRYNSKRSCGNLSFLEEKAQKEVEVFFGDLRDTDILAKAMSGVDVVFNLAALVGIPYSYINPHEVAMVNVIGTLNMLTEARQKGVEKFVQTSTSEVYGSPDAVPIKETSALKPQSPYSATKIGSDAIAMSFFYSFGMPVAIIRPFNTYGPRQSARAVIPTIINQAISGNIVKLGAGKPRRDFTYVKDTVDGFIKIAESDRSRGEIINIGTGEDISVDELVGLIGRLTGKELKVQRETKRVRPNKSEVTRLKADNAKAKRLLKWKPAFTLEEGLLETIKFIRLNKTLYDPAVYAV